MNLLDLLRPEHLLVPLEAPSVRAAVEQLMARLEETCAIEPSESLRRRVRSEPLREVTGVRDDFVIPHYRSDAVSSLVLALGIAPEPLTPEEPGLEIRPRVVALVLAPHDATSWHTGSIRCRPMPPWAIPWILCSEAACVPCPWSGPAARCSAWSQTPTS